MKIGKFTDKVPNWLVYLVFICIIVTIGLLYLKEKSQAIANYWSQPLVVNE